jgi:hypothetical protein
MVDVKRTISSLGFNEFPDEVARLLEMADWKHPHNRLRMGVVLTFALVEERGENYVKYIVDRLEGGNEVFLLRPAWVNKGFDYKLCIEGWDDSANPAPSHPDVYSDFYWKRENDSEEAVEALCEAALEVYEGESPDYVLEKYGDKFDFTVGRVPDSLIRAIPWLFIEQDIRYWNYSARDRTVEMIRDIKNGVELENLGLHDDDPDENDLQPLEEIEDTDLAI